MPYFSTLFNCIAWVLYCYPAFSNYVLPTLINMYGALINLVYAATYWSYTSPEQSKLCARYTAIGIGVLIPAVAAEYAYGREAMGYVAASINIIMYYSPLAAVSDVIKTKSVAKFPFLPLLFTFISGCCWTAFGVLTPDIPVLIGKFIEFDNFF